MVKKMTIEEAIEKAEEIALEKAETKLKEIIDDRLDEINEKDNKELREVLESGMEIDNCDSETFADTKSYYKGYILDKDNFIAEIEKGTDLGKKLDKVFEEDYYSASEYAYRITGIGQIFECSYKNKHFHSAKNYEFEFEVELTDEEDKCIEENCTTREEE